MCQEVPARMGGMFEMLDPWRLDIAVDIFMVIIPKKMQAYYHFAKSNSEGKTVCKIIKSWSNGFLKCV